MSFGDHDHRKAPWLIDGDRNLTFDRLAVLASHGLKRRQIAERLHTTRNALSCYMRRYGITIGELCEHAGGMSETNQSNSEFAPVKTRQPQSERR